MEMLSEHHCQGWLEGYLLTGRHGFFCCYEAFVHIVDSMFNQHAKWLKACSHIPWRRSISSLNYLLDVARLAPGPQRLQPSGPGLRRSRRQQKKAEIIRVSSRPTPTRLLSVADHCLRSAQLRECDRRRQAAARRTGCPWMTADQHCTAGAGISGTGPATIRTATPDIVMACAGDVPTLRKLWRRCTLLRQ